MNMRPHSILARLTVVLATVFASHLALVPAQAAEPDRLDMTVSGNTVVIGSPSKFMLLSAVNRGERTLAEIDFRADLSQLDRDIVDIAIREIDRFCDLDGDILSCHTAPRRGLAPNDSAGIAVPLVVKTATPGPAGTIEATASSGDATATVSTGITVADSGPDLYLFAANVPSANEQVTNYPQVPVSANEWWLNIKVISRGNATFHGLMVTIELPDRVTFTGRDKFGLGNPQQDLCSYSEDKKSATCVYPDFEAYVAEEHFEDFAPGEIEVGLKFDASTPRPSIIRGGKVTAQRLKAGTSEPMEDVDATDNTSDVVLRFAGPEGSPSPSASSGPGGSLPITGGQTGVLIAAGMLLVTGGVGGILFARRRRNTLDLA